MEFGVSKSHMNCPLENLETFKGEFPISDVPNYIYLLGQREQVIIILGVVVRSRPWHEDMGIFDSTTFSVTNCGMLCQF